jgi:hypothetical protein
MVINGCTLPPTPDSQMASDGGDLRMSYFFTWLTALDSWMPAERIEVRESGKAGLRHLLDVPF